MRYAILPGLLFALLLCACDPSDNPGEEPGVGSAPAEILGAPETALLLSADGASIQRMIGALAEVKGRHPEASASSLAAELDRRFEIQCQDICRIQERKE